MGMHHFLAQADAVAWFVLTVLIVMSIGTWYYIAIKTWHSMKTRRLSQQFVQSFWSAPSLEAVADRLRETGIADPFSHLVHHGFTAIEQHQSRRKNSLIEAGTAEEFLTRSLKRAIDQDKSRLEGGLTFLATVASSAPFVGLFGTVWGIYHALLAIGASGQGSLDQVAGPIGEALIMTGIGLAVAIPAAIGYNVFVRLNRNTLTALHAFAHDVFAFLSTGLATGALLNDAGTTDRVISRVRVQDPAYRDHAVAGVL